MVFWLIPIVCLYPMILRLKTITEHFDAGLRVPDNVQWTARTSAAGWLQNHLIGARMEYHFEHHVLPTIPFRGLRALHGPLDTEGCSIVTLFSPGYVRFLARAAACKRLRRARALMALERTGGSPPAHSGEAARLGAATRSSARPRSGTVGRFADTSIACLQPLSPPHQWAFEQEPGDQGQAEADADRHDHPDHVVPVGIEVRMAKNTGRCQR